MPPSLSRLYDELKRRHVFRVVAAYAALGFVVLQVADLVVEPVGLPDWTMRLLLAVVILGFPVALIVAWVFDLTPEGLEKTGSAAGGAPTLRVGGAALAAGAGALVLVAVGAYFGVRPDPLDPGEPLESVAVLPFVDMSAAGDQEYFSEGMTEELLDALAKVDGLRVAARTSAARFAGQELDIREIGRALGVQAVFEGSVRRDGDRLRVTAQLIDAETGFHLWSDSFDRTMTAVFEVQEEVAREIVRALHMGDAADALLVRPGTRDLDAYDRYLRGNHQLVRRTPESVRRALEAYDEALRLDPGFAAAMLGQAYAWSIWLDWGWPDPPVARDALIRRGDELVDRALAAEPDDPQAWLVRAYLRVVADPYSMTGAPALFERAAALAPRDPEILHQYGQTLMALGRFEEARAAYRRALDADPLRAMTLVPMAAMAFFERRFDASMAWADSAVAVDPSNPYVRAHRAVEQATVGSVDDAADDVEIALAGMQGHTVPVLGAAALVRGAAGDRAAALQLARRATEAAGPEISSSEGGYLATAWLGAARPADALAALRRTEPKGAWLWFYLQSPAYDSLRQEPEFVRLVAAADPRPATRADPSPFVAGP